DRTPIVQAIENANTIIQRHDAEATGFASASLWSALETAITNSLNAVSTKFFSVEDGFVSQEGIVDFDAYRANITTCANAVNAAVTNIKEAEPANRFAYNAALKYVYEALDFPEHINNWYTSGQTELVNLLTTDISAIRASQQTQLDDIAQQIKDAVDSISLVIKPADYTEFDAFIAEQNAYILSAEFTAKYTSGSQQNYKNYLNVLKNTSRDYNISEQSNLTTAIETFNTNISTLQRKSFTVTFKDYNGTTLKTQNGVFYGTNATPPSNPVRIGYTFTGWDTDYTNVTAATIVTAEYTRDIYTVNFYNYDGSVLLKTEEHYYGESATAPSAPERVGFEFTGWSANFDNITSSIDVYAQYAGVSSFTVTFKDWDGTTISSEIVDKNASATAPANPTRTGYTFTGWDKAFNNVTADLTVTAQYSINNYTVTFKDWDGTVLKTQNSVAYGSGATAPAAPTRTGYTFDTWDTDFSNVSRNLIVTATYTINSYTVLFNAMGGNCAVTSRRQEYNTEIEFPTDVTKTGCEFIGWNTDQNATTALTSLTVPAEDVTLYAIYNALEYTVTFKDWDGTTIATRTGVTYGSAATAPEEPERENYTFTGWSCAFNYVTRDLTVTAQYTINQYQITFNANGGSGSSVPVIANYGTTVNLPSTGFTKDGKVFRGWNTDPDATVALTSFTIPNHDTVLYAIYASQTYTVVFTGKDGEVISTLENVEHGATVTAPTPPEVEGYDFVSWDSPLTNITSSKFIHATYQKKVYTVTFKDWDGTVLKTSSNVEYGSNAEAPIVNPTRTGYTFSGWDKTLENITGSTEFTAQYTINQYTVYFDGNSGIASTESITQDYGTEVTLPTASRTGYDFLGWSTSQNSDTVIESLTIPANNDLTLFAVYRIKTFEVTFTDWDGTVIGTAQQITYGSDATLPLTTPERTGYTFSGWGTSYRNISANTTVVAQYNINSYKISFNGNGGTSLKADITREYNSSIDVSSSSTSTTFKIGYTCIGWNTNPDATEPLESFNVPAENTTLYAIYRKNQYTLSFDTTGLTQTVEAIVDFYQKIVQLPSNIIKEGFTFLGWSTDANAQTGLFEVQIPAENEIFYPIFRIRSCTVNLPNIVNPDPSTPIIDIQLGGDYNDTFSFKLNIPSIYKTKTVSIDIYQFVDGKRVDFTYNSETEKYEGAYKGDGELKIDNLEINYGDVTGNDEQVTMADTLSVFQYVTFQDNRFDETQLFLANVTKKPDNTVSMVDAMYMLMYVKGTITSFE
ncbi:MAG: InlB B-repeat-containing protein, partial [Clostridiales bacterium]|nr:InlB B-repeat-containing protein [Clostridiales bacterium]